MVKYKEDFLREKEQSTQEFTDSLKKSITAQIQKILDQDYDNPKMLYRKLSKGITQTIKKQTLKQALSDAYQQVNRGEELAVRYSKTRLVKIWTTQFDDRVREWHAAVHGQVRRQDSKFRVDYPGGTDYLRGPKIPPISIQNWINCRCFMEFKVRKK